MRSILHAAHVVAAPEVRLRGRRLSSVPDEEDVAEYDRNGAGLLIRVEDRAILDLEVKMRPQRVARVSYSGYLLPGPHALSLAHRRTSLLEVRHDRVAMAANLEGNVVAISGRLSNRPNGLVRV